MLEAATIDANRIEFRAGWAEMVGSGRPTITGRYIFHLNESDRSIFYKPSGSPGGLMARLLSATELEVAFQIPDQNRQVTTRLFLLHRQTNEAAVP